MFIKNQSLVYWYTSSKMFIMSLDVKYKHRTFTLTDGTEPYLIILY